MKIKIFTTNTNGKIEMTKAELAAIVDESYEEGYKAGSSHYTYTWTSKDYTPFVSYSAATDCCCDTTNNNSITLDTKTLQNNLNARAALEAAE